MLKPGGPPLWFKSACPPLAAPLSATTTKSTNSFKFSAIYYAAARMSALRELGTDRGGGCREAYLGIVSEGAHTVRAPVPRPVARQTHPPPSQLPSTACTAARAARCVRRPARPPPWEVSALAGHLNRSPHHEPSARPAAGLCRGPRAVRAREIDARGSRSEGLLVRYAATT